MAIHPTAVISKEATIDPSVEVGPFCIIKGKVTIGANSRLDSHVVLGNPFGETKIGENNIFFASSVIGEIPQDLTYNNEPTCLDIGDNNTFREYVTINTGTKKDKGITRLGNNNLIMAYVHIAHDCIIDNRTVIANSTQFAGHVHVEDDVKIGGICAFNQFLKIGRGSYVAGDSSVNKDIAPYTIAQGKYAVMRAANTIGMERSGLFKKEEIEALRKSVRFLLKSHKTVAEVLEKIEEEKLSQFKPVAEFVEFIKASERGLAI